jgi:hypothetical protein
MLCCRTALDGVAGLSGTDIGTAGAVAVPRWFLDAGNACHTCYTKHCHPCRAALKRAAACWLHSDMLPQCCRWRGWSVRHRYRNCLSRYCPSLVLRRWQCVPHMPHEPLPTVLCRPEACCCVLATLRHVAAPLSMAWLVCPAQRSEPPEPLLSLAISYKLEMSLPDSLMAFTGIKKAGNVRQVMSNWRIRA